MMYLMHKSCVCKQWDLCGIALFCGLKQLQNLKKMRIKFKLNISKIKQNITQKDIFEQIILVKNKHSRKYYFSTYYSKSSSS